MAVVYVERLLRRLHIFVLMNDTVLLSTTRQGMEQKLSLLNQYSHDNEMLANNKKKKFVFNYSLQEQIPSIVRQMFVK